MLARTDQLQHDYVCGNVTKDNFHALVYDISYIIHKINIHVLNDTSNVTDRFFAIYS